MSNKDTVEEFWDTNILSICREHAQQINVTDFLEELRIFLGASGKMWAAPSGRTALQQFLVDAVSTKRTSVLISSFNCQVVAEAVIQAGFQVETFDLADCTGHIDWEEISAQLRPQHGALVVPHLFGVPSDFRPVQETAERLGIIIIEDCAMTLGGKIDEFMAGILGDAAIFSFNYDKPISLGGGGGALLVNNPDLCSKIRLDQRPCSLKTEEQEIDLFMNYLQQRRQNIRLPKNIARRIFNRIERSLRLSKAEKSYPFSGIGPLRASLGVWQLKQYLKIVNKRNENAALFSNGTKCKSWYVGASISPAWVKQKVIPLRPDKVSQISLSLQRDGLRVGCFNWPVTMDQYLGWPEKPNASHIAKYGLDVPIHQNMTKIELERIREEICNEANE